METIMKVSNQLTIFKVCFKILIKFNCIAVLENIEIKKQKREDGKTCHFSSIGRFYMVIY